MASEGRSVPDDLGAHASAWPARLQAPQVDRVRLDTPACPDQSLVHRRTMPCPGMGSTGAVAGGQPEEDVKETENTTA